MVRRRVFALSVFVLFGAALWRAGFFALPVSVLLGPASFASAQAQQGGGARAGAPAGPGAGAPAQGARAGGGPARRPPLFFREEWKQNEKADEHPIAQDSVANGNLELKLYGPNAKEIALTGKA